MSLHFPVPGFELLELLAHNGHLIYVARQSSSGRLVQLNVVHSAGDYARVTADGLRQQAALLASLDHPNILRLVEVGDAQGYGFYSALEYAEGGHLGTKLRTGPLPPGQAASIARAICGILLYAQARNVVHDNLTPYTILLTGDSAPKLADFRLAGAAASGKEGLGIGFTADYAAPEQMSVPGGEVLAPRTNVYRVGAVLYAMLTGKPPFRGSDLRDSVRQVLEQSPAPVRQLNPAVPADLESLCMKCLGKSLEFRYADLGELGDALGRFIVDN